MYRRSFLRAALALPLLDAFRAGAKDADPPRRFVAVCTTLGIHGEHLFPAKPGDLAGTPYLDALKAHRERLSLFSGLSHPDVDGGHSSESCFLSAAPHPGQPGFKNSISFDQHLVEKLSPDTRYPSLTLSTSWGAGLSVTRAGVLIPADDKPSQIYRKLFVNGTPAEVRQQLARLREGKSVMDGVAGELKSLTGDLGARDKERLDQYLTGVREVELRLKRAEAWVTRPKPRTTAKPPTDVTNVADIIARTRLLFDLTALALQSDSTRVVTIRLTGMNRIPPIAGVSEDWHNLSHHGKDPEKLEQLKRIETAQLTAFATFLDALNAAKESGGTLLDRTAVVYGSNLGNASSHDTKNLPVILAGGGFAHGKYRAFDAAKNAPLCNLFVAVQRKMGVESERFASGTSAMAGL